ncbi:extensin-like domain-containing protein [Ciceribacter ferrooxidans]|uniref:extensin-like domain-containing protein n=1 Tax=Ciceribacter ferrooxidans TaxID=2509717 RepID=UPI001FE0C492|nr:extensin family protein [Ciceribacter ferrooxidans]
MPRLLLLAAALAAAPAMAAPDNPPVPLPKPPLADRAPAVGPPVPAEKPKERQAPAAPEPEKKEREPAEPPPPPPPPIETEDKAAFDACTAELTALGAAFRTLPRIDDGEGCGIDKPVAMTRLSAEVAIEPEVTARCETLLQLARMTRDLVEPAARLGLPDMGRLKAVHQASGYVCRKRNGADTGKISEHARGNAVDISALEFEKGPVPMKIVASEDSDLAAAFQRALNAAACLYFTTVLSPGSDDAHRDHMHLDVMKRTGGYRYCR